MSEQNKSPESRWHKYSTWLMNVTFLIAAFLIVSAIQARNMLSTNRIEAPELAAATLHGVDFDLADSESLPTLVYFFAPWCHYCAFSSDNLNRLREWREPDELNIITVALDWQSVDEVRAYAEKHELAVPVLLGNSVIARDWKVHGFPTYYVLDSEGSVVSRDIGYSTQLGLWWRTWAVD